jgi:hypothetical protein
MASKNVQVCHDCIILGLVILIFLQKQLKTDMDVIVRYVYWMKNQQGIAKLSDEPKIGFKALFTLLEMKS